MLLLYNYFTTGGLIGTLPNEQHRIAGELYIVDSKTIFIEDFNYDGGGPGRLLCIEHYLMSIYVNTDCFSSWHARLTRCSSCLRRSFCLWLTAI